MPDGAYVRFFTKSRRGVATQLVKGLGQVKIKKGSTPTVTIKDDVFEVQRTIIRRIDLPGSTYDLLVVWFKYSKQKMDVPPTPPKAGLQARLLITLTNQPVDDEPEDVEIAGEDDDPVQDEDETPTMPDDDVILNT
ncbi:MAG: hypothetical protein BGO49_08235 [Planctomycetales bacterium 71-10]|nr:MAG: hypothetical protein BGO49_08235 [Planctomycetales bacterium 71-10]